MKKNIILIIILLVIIICISGCKKSESKSVSKSGYYFDTVITITLYGTDDETLVYECFNQAETYEKLLSTTMECSDIYKINNNAGSYVTVDERTIEVLNKALYFSNLSEGTFDITIGALSSLWNISDLAESLEDKEHIAEANAIPNDDLIKDLIEHVDYHSIEISGNQVKLDDPSAQIDLGAIAKGYIADQMKIYLNEKGITSGIINLGGNIITLGPKNNDETYKLGLQYPFGNTGDVIASLNIKDSSVVTSGIYERYIIVDDKLYHHILDTKTGYPIDNELLSVTIISDSSCDGDALSTTVLAMGKEKGIDFIESLDNIEAVFIDNEYNVTYTSGLNGIINLED